jgi:hypothetical protein
MTKRARPPALLSRPLREFIDRIRERQGIPTRRDTPGRKRIRWSVTAYAEKGC